MRAAASSGVMTFILLPPPSSLLRCKPSPGAEPPPVDDALSVPLRADPIVELRAEPFEKKREGTVKGKGCARVGERERVGKERSGG